MYRIVAGEKTVDGNTMNSLLPNYISSDNFLVTYSKCSKILHTFFFLFSSKGWNSQNTCQYSKQGDPDQTEAV